MKGKIKMKKQSRRSFCQTCFMASVGIGTAASLAPTLPSLTDAEALANEQKKSNHSDQKIDYTKVGYCGYCCDICPGRSEDKNIRRKMVEGWKKIFGHTSYTEENIPIAKPCAGCKGKGDVSDTQCQARACAREKGVIVCADCDQFPCKKLRPLLSNRNDLLLYVKDKSVTLEEYTMSAMQFENMPVLLKRLIDSGKMPSWVDASFLKESRPKKEYNK